MIKWLRNFSLLGFGLCITIILNIKAKADDYVILYNYGQKVSWCSSLCLLKTCDSAPLFCYYAPKGYEYYYQDVFFGYYRIYNPLDARVVCGYAPADVSKCLGSNYWTINYHICKEGIPGCRIYGKIPKAFRVFLPPGAESFRVIIHFARDVEAGIAIRFGKVPEAYQDLPENYDDIPWRKEGLLSLDELKEELFYPNRGGTILLDAEFSSLSQDQADWLYFHILPQFSNDVYEFQISIQLNYETYKSWFKKVSPCPSSDIYCWDYLGNPIKNNQSNDIIPPTWSVKCLDDEGIAHFWVRVSDCGSLCGQKIKVKVAASSGTTIDYSWLPEKGWEVGDKSFEWELSPIGSIDLLAQENIATVNLIGWYAGVFLDWDQDGQFSPDKELRYCQFRVICDENHLSLCSDKNSCEAVGGYWVDNLCQKTPCDITSSEECRSFIDQESCIQGGCGWSKGNPGVCYSCSYAKTENICNLLVGCYWDGRLCLPQSCNY